MFLCNPPLHSAPARELADQIARLPETDYYSRRHLVASRQAVEETIQTATCAAPIAGPEDLFRRGVLSAAMNVLELHTQTMGVELPELVRTYSDVLFDAADERHPLSAEERSRLLALWRRYEDLSRHPYLNVQKPPLLLNEAFISAGYAPAKVIYEDLTPADVMKSYRKVKVDLYHLTYKHFLLWRVRQAMPALSSASGAGRPACFSRCRSTAASAESLGPASSGAA